MSRWSSSAYAVDYHPKTIEQGNEERFPPRYRLPAWREGQDFESMTASMAVRSVPLRRAVIILQRREFIGITRKGRHTMRVITKLTGTRPLLLHNVQLADPDNRWARQIAQITKKRTKTEEDRRAIADIEWEGGLYIHEGVISMPTANVLRSFVETAKIGKQGKTINRALTPTELSVPLVYSGPKDLEELKRKPEFRDQAMVRVGTQRILRTRPIFRSWALFLEWELLTEVLDLSDFESIVIQSGRVEGLGDNRKNGYGRFSAEVAEVSLRKAA